jgi:tripartite-type tricarboxylate transporter receptor subunit TctC
MMIRLWTLVIALVFFAGPVAGGSVEDFYKGKTIRIVVGFGPGGATDTISRLLQRVLSKHVPGVIPQSSWKTSQAVAACSRSTLSITPSLKTAR